MALSGQTKRDWLWSGNRDGETGQHDARAADAYPIITENKISTMWMTAEKEWCAWSGGDLEEGCWVPDYCFCGESPLRAAMIVFLMMQVANNA
ncbi:TPA: phage protein NinX family protein [Escherichia coli]